MGIFVGVLGLGRSFCRAVDEIVDYSGEGVMEHDKCVRPPRVSLVGDVEVALDNPWDYLCWYLEKYGLELRSGLAVAVLHCVIDRLYNYLRMGLVCVEVCRSSSEVCLEMALSSVENMLRRWKMKFSMYIGSSSCPYHYTAVIKELRPRVKVSSGFIVERVLDEIRAKGLRSSSIGSLYYVLIERAKRMVVYFRFFNRLMACSVKAETIKTNIIALKQYVVYRMVDTWSCFYRAWVHLRSGTSLPHSVYYYHYYDYYGDLCDVDYAVLSILHELSNINGRRFRILMSYAYGDDLMKLVSLKAVDAEGHWDLAYIGIFLTRNFGWNIMDNDSGEAIVVRRPYMLINLLKLRDVLLEEHTLSYLIDNALRKHNLVNALIMLAYDPLMVKRIIDGRRGRLAYPVGISILKNWSFEVKVHIIGDNDIVWRFNVLRDFTRREIGFFFENVALSKHILNELFPNVKHIVKYKTELNEIPHEGLRRLIDSLASRTGPLPFDAILIHEDDGVTVLEVKYARTGEHYSDREKEFIKLVRKLGIPVLTLAIEPMINWVVRIRIKEPRI